MDGENWNWLVLGAIYMFVKKPDFKKGIYLFVTCFFAMIHFLDNSRVLNKYIKTNISYGYEFVLLFLFFIFIYLYIKGNYLNTPIGRFLFILIILSNIFRIIGSVTSRIIFNNYKILWLKI